MSLPTSYASILNDLNRDVLRARPTDPLQFCANWFNKRLEEQRQGWLSNNPSALSQQQHALLGGVRQGEISAINVAAPSPFTQSAPSSSPFANSSDAPPASTGGASPTQTSLFTTPAPFNSGNSYPGVPLSAGMTGLSSDDDTGASPDPSEDDDAAPFIPPSFNLGRRTSVAAESIKLSAKSAPLKKTVIPKTEEQLQNIRASIGNNLLFRNLEEDQHRDVLLAMKEVKVDAGVAVIEQGAQGDYFYVVQSGSLDVYVRAAGTASSQSSDDGRGPSSSLAALGDKKVSYGPGASFGELALLYAQPRAATVLSTSPCTLWALDRITFRSILMETNSRRRNMYENFLKEVSLFEHLSASELAKISDALELRTYEIGQEVIKQGESGTEFYIIVEGHAEVIKARDGTKETVGKLTKGDYFGELALLNSTPRAATITACAAPTEQTATEGNKLRVATLSERAFTRLLGPLAGIMQRNAATNYGPSASADVGPSPGLQTTSMEVELGPHETSATPGMGTWIGGPGASPFGGAQGRMPGAPMA